MVPKAGIVASRYPLCVGPWRAQDARMVRTLVMASLMMLAAALRPVPAAEVTIYRCVDAHGKVSLRDTPCLKGEQQETRTMVRPKDAAPRPSAPPSPSPARDDYTERPRRVVVAYPPRPLYECTTPDGQRYTSENAEGNPRWVPLWTLGYPVYPTLPRQEAGVDFRIRNRHVDISGGSHTVSGSLHPAAAYGAGTWIRDACYALPQAEVCARMVDRRDEIRRRFFNAMPSERDVLRVEERGINARLANDCGTD